jgi:hypothetical protein
MPVLLAQVVVTLVGSAIALPRAGLPGVAWAITIPYLIVSVAFWPAFLRKTVGIPVGSFLRDTWVRPLAAIVPFAACTYVSERFWPASSLAFFFLQVGLLLPVAALGGWYFCLTIENRAMLMKSVRGFSRG